MTLTREEREAILGTGVDVVMQPRGRWWEIVPTREGGCPLYDHGCTIYDVRPLNCRRYMCGREDGEPAQPGVIPMRVFATKRLRKQYLRNQRQVMEEWGHAHGWRPE